MAKLTKVQRAIMLACPEWSADWEIRDRLGRQTLGGIPSVLHRLSRRGLVDFARANFTYRITDAGRAALSSPQHPSGE